MNKICSWVFPTLVEQANYIFGLKNNLEALKNAILELDASNADVVNEVETQKRQGLQQLDTVRLWISKVEVIEREVCLLLDDSEVELKRLYMNGYCSNDFGLTYRHGKIVSEKLKEVKILLSTKPSVETVARRGLSGLTEEATTQKTTIGLEDTVEAAWNCLMEDKVGILGLYGMAGIGKTTLLEQIKNMFIERKDEYGVVISVVVSQDLQIERIQKEIGNKLGLFNKDWEVKSRKEKASDIRKVLTRQRFVMLLDDIWRKVELEEIGIPLPTPQNKSKVVFTTRSQKVCGRMGPNDIEIKCLGWENAWELFQQKVTCKTLESDPKIQELARTVCKKCNGLPLALNVVGETMARKKTLHKWQDAISVLNSNAIRYPEVKEEILKTLKFSYDDLEDETTQQCFLYCALFPEDQHIEKRMLVDYWICEGIINGGGDREKALNQGYSVIATLVSSCLLINHEHGVNVKMHDVVRQTALWIASNFVVKTGSGLHQIPEVRDWSVVTRMSLENNEIQNISVTLECPNLITLILRENRLVSISGQFFLRMPKLVVLDLSYNEHLRNLPEQVSKLVSLRYLGLAETKLENLPAGLGKLIQLKHLDLCNIHTLRRISSVIPRLVNLETLILYGSIFLTRELVENIKLLENLKVLHVSFNDLVTFEHLLSIPRLARCMEDVCLEGFEATYVSFAKSTASLRSLAIQGCLFSDICISPSVTCFQNLNIVKISQVGGIQDLTCLLFAPNLTCLFVFGPSLQLKEIISREKVFGIMNKGSSIIPFQNLRLFCLDSLIELRSIYWEPLDFSSLVLLFVNKCPNLKKLPFNKESSMRNDFQIGVNDKEWFDGIEWEDEVTKHKFIHSQKTQLVRTHFARYSCLSSCF